MRRLKLWWHLRQDRKWFNRYFEAEPWGGAASPIPAPLPGVSWDQPDADPAADMRLMMAEWQKPYTAEMPPLVVPGWFSDKQLAEAVEWLKTSPYRDHFNGVLRIVM